MRLILILLLIAPVVLLGQTKPKYLVPQKCSVIYAKVDSLPEKALKEGLFNSGFTFEIDKDGYWKTTNSLQVSVMPIFLNGYIYKSDTGIYIVIKGQQDDSYFNNITTQVLAGVNTNSQSRSPIKCEGSTQSVLYRAFCKMLQVSERIGSVSFMPSDSKKMVRIYPSDIKRD